MRLWVALLLSACNVPEPPPSTGGTDEPAGPCGRGFTVVDSDFASSNVSLVALDGRVLSSSFLSSATSSGSLSVPLSTDVVLPTMAQPGSEVVLIDRYPASVLTWVNVETARVERQLTVKTGYVANPHDVIFVSDDKAYVTRFDPNPKPGAEPFDQGDDVLVIDPSVPSILSRIDLAPAMAGEDPQYFARPSRGALIGGRVIVVLEAYNQSFDASAASRLVAIDPETDAILDTLVLPGLEGCEGFAVSEAGRIALGCLGSFGGVNDATIEESGVALIETAGGLAEIARFPAASIAETPLGFGIAWASEQKLLVTSAGSDTHDALLVEVDIQTGVARTLLSRQEPTTLADVQCAPSCGVCVAADAERGVLAHFQLENGKLGTPREIRVDEAIGLPPQRLGRF